MAQAENGEISTLVIIGAASTALGIASQRNFTINYDSPSIETDAKGDTSITNMPSRVNASCSVEALYVHTDAAQQRLLTLKDSNTQVSIQWFRSAALYATATATITSLSLAYPDKDAAMFTCELDIDGNFTFV